MKNRKKAIKMLTDLAEELIALRKGQPIVARTQQKKRTKRIIKPAAKS